MMIGQVYDRYRELLLRYAQGRILKTDCFNEGLDDFRYLGGILPKDTIYLEIDPAIIERAKTKHLDYDLRQGDIRCLPFNNGFFDTVFDLSTLDHIPQKDVATALGEYRRVLIGYGLLVLVVWCSEGETGFAEWGDGPQYFFEESAVLNGLAGFHILDREVIHRGDGIYLVNFIARKEAK
jgi:SAM-dependent methyltransferase